MCLRFLSRTSHISYSHLTKKQITCLSACRAPTLLRKVIIARREPDQAKAQWAFARRSHPYNRTQPPTQPRDARRPKRQPSGAAFTRQGYPIEPSALHRNFGQWHSGVNGKIRSTGMHARLDQIHSEHGNHGAIVGTQLDFRNAYFDATLRAKFEKLGSQL